MPASPAQIAANQANSARSTGPRTSEGKSRSRANSFKHGLTGAGVVLPEEDAAEVERLSESFRTELKAEGDVGRTLARRMATMSVRMDRCVDQETAARTERVLKAMDDFEAPEGLDAAEVERLRNEAGRRALFDSSKEATQVRKYEAAAERAFFRAFKELRQLKNDSAKDPVAEITKQTAAQFKSSLKELGSFLPAKATPAPAPAQPTKSSLKHLETPLMPLNLAPSGVSFVPLSVGRAR
jgi:hypothetical protein